jgi:DNA polymerase-3 subunit epsilon
VLAAIGRCGAPCEGGESTQEYGVHRDAAAAAITGDPAAVVEGTTRRIAELAAALRYEEAGAHRDRLRAFLRSAARGQRLTAFTRVPLVVAARPRPDLGWEVAVVRHGRLAATGTVPRGADPWPTVDGLRAASDHDAAAVPAQLVGPTPLASAEESELLLRWLTDGSSRLVVVEGTWAHPVAGAEAAWQRWSPEPLRSATPFPTD